MPTSFTYPTASELTLIEQDKMPLLTQDDPIFTLFPIVNKDTDLVMWEQRDNYVGLQQARGLNAEPARVKAVGGKRYQMEPGVYGEFGHIDEKQLTQRRRWGSYNQPIAIDDLVMEKQDQLLNRRVDRLKYNLWTLLSTGELTVSGPNGAIIHADKYTFQTHAAAVAWGTAATATPLVDLRAVQLKARGHSLSFGREAVAFANIKTVNKLLGNTNSADIGGKRLASGATFNALTHFNSIFLDNDLPQFVVYDEGYLNDSGTFVPFIPDDFVVIVGRRPNGQTIGEYQMTRNANNPDLAPGPYTRVIDRGDEHVPRSIEVHDGHNGGIAIFFPSAIVLLDVTP